MRESIAYFISQITSISPGLRATYEDTIAYWAPDAPPVTTALSELGRKVVDDFDLVGPAANKAIFRAIEKAMESGDVELSTVVATGMIEGIIGRGSRANAWDKIRPILGNASAHHADAWTSR